jgi:hypothetical protein
MAISSLTYILHFSVEFFSQMIYTDFASFEEKKSLSDLLLRNLS